jgi:hypothetical protein
MKAHTPGKWHKAGREIRDEYGNKVAEAATLDDIIAGRVNLFITLANANGVIKSIERQPVNLNEAIQFCDITEPCSVTHAIIGTDDGSWSTEVKFDSHRQVTAMPGDSVTVSKLNISYA